MVILRVSFAKNDKKCHPKRVFNPCRGKKDKFGGQPLHTSNDEPKGVPESESVAGSASTSNNDREKKKKKFLPQWLKTYGWLKDDEDKNFMYCDVCTKFNSKNSLHQKEECRNYQHTTLVRHLFFPVKCEGTFDFNSQRS